MRGREDSLSSCNQKVDCLRSRPSSMLVPTDRRLSCHSGLAVTLSTTTEKLKTLLLPQRMDVQPNHYSMNIAYHKVLTY